MIHEKLGILIQLLTFPCGTGKDHVVLPVQIQIPNNGKQLFKLLVRQKLQLADIDGGIRIAEWRVGVPGEKLPALIRNTGTVDNRHWLILKFALGIDKGSHLFFPRTVFPENHDGSTGLIHLVQRRRIGSGRVGEAVEAGIKLFQSLAPVDIANSIFDERQRDFPGVDVIDNVSLLVNQFSDSLDGNQQIAFISVKFLAVLGKNLRHIVFHGGHHGR